MKENEKLSERDIRDKKAKSMGAIHCIDVIAGDTTKLLYLKQPHRHVLGLYLAKQRVNPIEAAEAFINNCVIKEVSDTDILTNDAMFLACIEHISDLVEVKKSALRTL